LRDDKNTDKNNAASLSITVLETYMCLVDYCALNRR